MVRALARLGEGAHQRLRRGARGGGARQLRRRPARRADHVTFHHIPTNEPWCRDHGPIFVTRNDEDPRLAIVDWGYNAWGGKYPPFDLDDVVPTRIAEQLGLPVFHPGIVLEGGSIDVNGRGTLLTTEVLPAQPQSQPGPRRGARSSSTSATTSACRRSSGWATASRATTPTGTWTTSPASSTDHRRDRGRGGRRRPRTTSRSRRTSKRLQTMEAEDGTPLGRHHAADAAAIVHDGQRLPASYANFYIANKVVLLPVFADAHDKWAVAVLEKAFPDRKIVPIDCRELIWGLGAFHCLTQQQPKG